MEENAAALIGPHPELRPITAEEIGSAIACANRKRAPGLDGKRADVVREAFKAAPDLMVALFNRCLEEGCFPAEWKKGQVVAFLKSPLKDRMETASYRPITLLPVVAKVLEKVLVRRLQLVAPPCDTQYGFTSGRSTVDALLKARELVSASTSKYVLGVFVDFKGAFDHLSWGSILRKLQDIGCGELALWRSYFDGRRSCMVGRQDVVWHEVVRGCPQGSICGPFMWNLLMSELLRKLRDAGVRHVAYADDLLLVVDANSRMALEAAAVSAVQHAVDWGAVVGVNVSYSKTEALLLKGSLNHERMPTMRMGDNVIRTQMAVKYLGLWVTHGFRFERHLREVASKMVMAIAPLRRVLKRDWGLKRKAIALWLNGLLKPTALYAAPVWYRTAQTDGGKRLVGHLQRLCLMAIVRACRTVSTEALQVLAGSTPWHLEALRLAVRYKLRNGLQMEQCDRLSNLQAAGADAAAVIDRIVADEWQRQWTESQKGRVTFAYIQTVGVLTSNVFDPPTRTLYLLTGHGSLNAYLATHTAGQATAECDCGAESEDWRHVLVECPRYADLRDLPAMGVLVEPGDRGEPYRLDVSEVLASQQTYHRFVEFAEAVFVRRSRQMANAAARADAEADAPADAGADPVWLSEDDEAAEADDG